MKKYVLASLVLGILVALWLLPISLSSIILNFLALGLIPGTEIELGFALPVGVGLITFTFLLVWIKQTSGELMDYKTEVALKEEAIKAQAKTPASLPKKAPLETEEIDLLSI